MLIWTLTFFLIHVCISAVFPKMLTFVILTSDLDPQGQRSASAVVRVAGPSARAPQARRPLSSAQPGATCMASCVPSRASPVPQPGAATLGAGQTILLSPGGGASGQVHLHRRAPAHRPRLRPRSSQAWTLEPPSLMLRRPPVLPLGLMLRNQQAKKTSPMKKQANDSKTV